MKKILVFIFSCFAVSVLYSQKLEIFYEDPCQYVYDIPTYLFQRIRPLENNITITDSTFFNHVARMVGNFSKCESSCCKSYVWYGMIQVVVIYDEYNYDVINMTHSMGTKTLDSNHGCLEMNGKIMDFSREFQEVMDEIVNYHITHPSLLINHRFLIELIKGKRYHLVPYTFEPKHIE